MESAALDAMIVTGPHSPVKQKNPLKRHFLHKYYNTPQKTMGFRKDSFTIRINLSKRHVYLKRNSAVIKNSTNDRRQSGPIETNAIWFDVAPNTTFDRTSPDVATNSKQNACSIANGEGEGSVSEVNKPTNCPIFPQKGASPLYLDSFARE